VQLAFEISKSRSSDFSAEESSRRRSASGSFSGQRFFGLAEKTRETVHPLCWPFAKTGSEPATHARASGRNAAVPRIAIDLARSVLARR